MSKQNLHTIIIAVNIIENNWPVQSVEAFQGKDFKKFLGFEN